MRHRQGIRETDRNRDGESEGETDRDREKETHRQRVREEGVADFFFYTLLLYTYKRATPQRIHFLAFQCTTNRLQTQQ